MESIQLTGLQREKLIYLHDIVISAQNALDMMKFPNDFNDTPSKVDATIALSIRRIESHLRKIKEAPSSLHK